MFVIEKMLRPKMLRPLTDKLPAVRSGRSVYQTLFKIIYLSAIAIATLGWSWLLMQWALELIT
jgi:hypothetical protein